MTDTTTETPVSQAAVRQVVAAEQQKKKINPNVVLLFANLTESAILVLSALLAASMIKNFDKLHEVIAVLVFVAVINSHLLLKHKNNISANEFIQLPFSRRLIRGISFGPLPIICTTIFISIVEPDILRDWDTSWILWRWSAIAGISVVIFHICVWYKLRHWRAEARLVQRVAVVGAGTHADRLVKWLDLTYRDLIEIVGVFDDRGGERFAELPLKHRVQGTIDDLLRMSENVHIDRILVALPHAAEERLLYILRRLRRLPGDITLAPDMIGFAVVEQQDRKVGALPLFDVYSRPLKVGEQLVKTVFDRVVAAGLIFLFLPIILLICLVVSIDSRGPIFFRQKRYGLGHRVITVLKFRTMYSEHSDYSCFRQTQVCDPRTTRIGRWLRRMSLDELPQLFNVLRGDMSLIGPRPLAIEMRVEDKLNADLVSEYCWRHRVKPGITGWAQIHGLRGAIYSQEALEERVTYDLYYIDNWSLWLDIKILVYTIKATLTTTNAY